MHRSKMLRFVTSCLLLTAMLPGVTGCNSTIQPAPDEEQAPDIPPASTFVMDFSDFGSAAAPKITVEGATWADPATQQVGRGSNWAFAALNVGVWNVILTVTMAVPVAAFVESFNHIPVRQADGTWVWSYDVTVGGVLHSAELHALAVGGDIEWRMFLSKDGFYTDFEWFSGVSNLVGTEGTWTLNRDPDDPTPFVGIEWNRDPTNETADIRYSNIVPDGPENGGYIFHSITDDSFDASYEIFNKGQDNVTTIEWSRTSKEGRVTDAVHFGDTDWHCWDAGLLNITCP